jgi:hypothetical protein
MHCGATFAGHGAGLSPFSQVQSIDGLRLAALASASPRAQWMSGWAVDGFLESWTLPLVGTFEPLNVFCPVLRVLRFPALHPFSPHFKG